MRPCIFLGERRRSQAFATGAALVLLIGVNPGVRVIAQSTGAPAPPDALQGNAPVSITLEEAIHRAEANDPSYASARADSSAAALDRWIARTGMLPGAIYHNQSLYTQPNGLQTRRARAPELSPLLIFIANNAVREYASQAVINEDIGLAQISGVRRADAAAAVGRGRSWKSPAADSSPPSPASFTARWRPIRSSPSPARQRQEADDFTKLTGQREQAREAAHADTVKAQLEQQQRERELSDAKIEADKARLELAVLLSRSAHALHLSVPGRSGAAGLARGCRSARGQKQCRTQERAGHIEVSNADVTGRPRRLSAQTLASTTPTASTRRNLPSTARTACRTLATRPCDLDIPVWDWLATEHKVKQSEIRRDAAQGSADRNAAPADRALDEAYAEAQAARDQLASLDASVATAAESLRLTKLRYTAAKQRCLKLWTRNPLSSPRRMPAKTDAYATRRRGPICKPSLEPCKRMRKD